MKRGFRRGGLYTKDASTLDDAMLDFAAAKGDDAKQQQIINNLTEGDKQKLRDSLQFPNKDDGTPDDHEEYRNAAIALLPPPPPLGVGGRRKSKRRKTRRRKTRR